MERPLLYVALLGNPGSVKSHPMKFAMKPILERDILCRQRYTEELKEQEKLFKAFGFQTFLAGTIGYSLYYVCRTSLNVVKKPILDSGMLDASQLGVIGKGCFVAEIQQTSDLTYRIYDFGRLDLDGKPRQLHTEIAKVFIWEYFYHMCNKK